MIHGDNAPETLCNPGEGSLVFSEILHFPNNTCLTRAQCRLMGQDMGQRLAVDNHLRGDITTTQLFPFGNSRELWQHNVSDIKVVAFWYSRQCNDAWVNTINA